MASEKDADVVDLLVSQHGRINHAMERVLEADAADRQGYFDDLVRLLAVHESIEAEVIHPAARRHSVSDEIVDSLRHEELEAEHALTELHELGVLHRDFDARFRTFAGKVTEHAEHEEKEEFARLLLTVSPGERGRLAGVVRLAESLAPTPPPAGPGASAVANLLAGPPQAVFDRVHGVIRDWRRRSGDV